MNTRVHAIRRTGCARTGSHLPRVVTVGMISCHIARLPACLPACSPIFYFCRVASLHWLSFVDSHTIHSHLYAHHTYQSTNPPIHPSTLPPTHHPGPSQNSKDGDHRWSSSLPLRPIETLIGRARAEHGQTWTTEHGRPERGGCGPVWCCDGGCCAKCLTRLGPLPTFPLLPSSQPISLALTPQRSTLRRRTPQPSSTKHPNETLECACLCLRSMRGRSLPDPALGPGSPALLLSACGGRRPGGSAEEGVGPREIKRREADRSKK